MKRFAFIVSALALCLAGAAPGASAATITFSDSAGGLFVGPLVEDDLTVTLYSGGLFVFDQASVARFAFGAPNVVFEGDLGLPPKSYWANHGEGYR